jgi:hypothetical protein
MRVIGICLMELWLAMQLWLVWVAHEPHKGQLELNSLVSDGTATAAAAGPTRGAYSDS